MADGILWPHWYRVLFDLATAETEHGEDLTVADIYPGEHSAARERRGRAGHAWPSLVRLGLVESCGNRGKHKIWRTTAKGYDTVYRSGL